MTGRKSYKEAIERISETTGLDYGELVDELRYSAENMQFVGSELPGLIRQLRANSIKVLVATDNMDTFSKWTVPALRLDSMFDGILASDMLGALKSHLSPDGENLFFQAYLTKHALAPSQSALIDNSLNNKVVERQGIEFLHVNESESAASHLKRILRVVTSKNGTESA